MKYKISNRMQVLEKVCAGLLYAGALCAVFFCAALLLAGCGAGEGRDGQTGGGMRGDEKKGIAAAKQEDGRNLPPRGRFMEMEIPFEEGSAVKDPVALLPWENGLYLADKYGADAWLELDGKSFSEDAEPAERAVIRNIDPETQPKVYREHLTYNRGFFGMAMAANGARMYSIANGSETKFFLDAEGRETEWDADGAVAREEKVAFRCGEDGNFYVQTLNEAQRLYRVDAENGETECLMENNSWLDFMVFGGRIFAEERDGIHIFDPETAEELERDKALNELLKDQAGGEYRKPYEVKKKYLLYPGRDDSIYVVTDRGLYRHVLYGNVSELLIDGALCSMGDISKSFVGMYVDEAGENGMPVFYILYSDKKLVRFAYDPDAASVPEDTLVIYGLEECRDIRLVIDAYRKLHPEIHLRYEVGMSGEDATTREDILSDLATRIAAGEGPDVFVLDDLPYRTYAEKGVLLNLDGLYGELKGEQNYFDNVIRPLYREGKLYALPMMFAVPMLVGEEEVLDGITDRESMVRAVENSSLAGAEGELRTGMLDAYSLLLCMSYANSGSWTAEDGSLDREAIAEFLYWCQRLYEADREERAEGKLAQRTRYFREAFMRDIGGYESISDYDYKDGLSTRRSYRVRYLLRDQMYDKVRYWDPFAIGLSSGCLENDINFLLDYVKETETGYIPLPGEGRTALPFAMLGVNAASAVKETAKDFVRYAMSGYQWDMRVMAGIPINRDVLIAQEKNKREGESLYGPGANGIMSFAGLTFRYFDPDGFDKMAAGAVMSAVALGVPALLTGVLLEEKRGRI